MALSTAPVHPGRPGASQGHRGRPERIPVHAAVGAILEEQVLCHAVIEAMDRIYGAATVGSIGAVMAEAGAISRTAQDTRDELRRLAREIDR